MNLFNLFAKLTLDNSDYEKGLKESGKQASSFSSKAGVAFKAVGKVVAGVVGAVVAVGTAVVAVSQKFADFTGDIDDNAQRLGMSNEEYQKWAMAVKLAGGEINTFKMAMRQSTKFTKLASEGNAEALLTLDELGIGYEEFANLDPAEQFRLLVEKLQGVEDQTDKARLAQEIFGDRAAMELMPLLNMEAGSLEDLFNKTEDLGLVMSNDAVAAGAEFGDTLDIIKTKLGVLGASMVSEFLPELKLLFGGILEVTTGSEEGFEKITDGAKGMIDKLLAYVVDLPKFLPKILEVSHTMVTNVIQSILDMDWGAFVINLFDALLKILFKEIPTFVTNLMNLVVDTVFDLLGLFFTEQGREKLAKFGVQLAVSLLNGLITGIETGINITLGALNKILDGISKIWTWAGIDAIPHIPDVTIPKIPDLFAKGGMFDKFNQGTMYAIAGESGAEIVAQGPHGTGVANIEQIAQAQYMAMEDYDIKGIINKAVVNIVNGLSMILSNNGGNLTNVVVKIGDKELNNVVVKAVDGTLKSQGRKSLSNITSYNGGIR